MCSFSVSEVCHRSDIKKHHPSKHNIIGMMGMIYSNFVPSFRYSSCSWKRSPSITIPFSSYSIDRVIISAYCLTMGTLCRISLALVLFCGVWEFSSCYSILPRQVVKNPNGHHLSTTSLGAKSHSEYSVDDESADEERIITREESNDVVIKKVKAEDPTEDTEDQLARQRPEYGALSPGTVVQVQVGDLALARKAWKKRRRTGSPLLVPCSVLNVDRQSMVRWNLIFLLEKFGHSRKDGIEITEADLSKKYRSYLQSSLQVREVGHDIASNSNFRSCCSDF